MLRRALQTVSWLAWIGTLVPAVLFFRDQLSLEQLKSWMLALAVVWFVVTPLWMGRELKQSAA